MTTLHVALVGLGTLAAAFTLLWAVSLRLRDASITDPFWGPGFLLVGVAYLAAHGDVTPRAILAIALVAAWAARLGLHLLRRNRTHGEDPRYAAIRAAHGGRFAWMSLGTVFWLQAVLVWVVSLPLLGAVAGRSPLGAWDVAGTAMFAAGFLTEAVADTQLARFRADPANRGTVLDRGLWRYSRHPNYFGDALLWWGLYLLAVGASAPWTVVSPAVMTFLLVKVSGVALLERSLAKGRPGYAEYVRRTSAFVPWFPRH
jgi:steroid 5-alpha reductase family enzyme